MSTKVVDTKAMTLSGGIGGELAPSILDERPASIPVMGVIRAGIKVLTKAAAENPKAASIYKIGVEAQVPFDTIAREITDKCKIATPLVPKNVRYFTARRGDFGVPEVADMINDTFSTDGPDGRRLYRLPVIFPVDAWQQIIPHSLKCWTANELQFWSSYGPDGVRYCMTRKPAAIDPKTKRAMRLFGGREVILRPDNGGRCVPRECPQYQQRKCNLSGAFLFYMPGIPGAGCIQIKTTSIYSMADVKQALEMVAFMRGGRISGVRPDGRPLFYLTKQQREIVQLDPETGAAKRTKQWLIVLEADMQMGMYLPGGQAAAGAPVAALTDGLVDRPGADPDDEEGLGVIEGEADEPVAQASLPPPLEPEPDAAAEMARKEEIQRIVDLRKRVSELSNAAGIKGDIVMDMMNEEFPPGWAKHEKMLQAVVAMLETPSVLAILGAIQANGFSVGDTYAYGQREHAANWFSVEDIRLKVLEEMKNAQAFRDAIEIPF